MSDFLIRKYPLQTMADTVFEVLCTQISADYTSIIRNQMLPELADKDDIGLREIRVLLMIEYQEKMTSSATIAHTLRYDPGTVTRASKRLVTAGYIKRKKSAQDRRTLYFVLTETGKALAEKYRVHIRNRFLQLESESGAILSYEERMVIVNILEKLRNRSEAMVKTDQIVPEMRRNRA